MYICWLLPANIRHPEIKYDTTNFQLRLRVTIPPPSFSAIESIVGPLTADQLEDYQAYKPSMLVVTQVVKLPDTIRLVKSAFKAFYKQGQYLIVKVENLPEEEMNNEIEIINLNK